MKNAKYITSLSLLLTALALASSTMAQSTEDHRTESETKTRNIDSIAEARIKYTQSSDINPDASNTTLAQLRGVGAGRPFPAQRGYPRGTYQTPWTDHGNAGHILIGAAIGFGIGAALGASNSSRDGTPVAGGIVIGGGLFALLGGCVGKAVGDLQGLHFASAHHRGSHLPSVPSNAEDSELASHPIPLETHTEQSPQPTARNTTAASRRVEP
jgi:hypothetical protein